MNDYSLYCEQRIAQLEADNADLIKVAADNHNLALRTFDTVNKLEAELAEAQSLADDLLFRLNGTLDESTSTRRERDAAIAGQVELATAIGPSWKVDKAVEHFAEVSRAAYSAGLSKEHCAVTDRYHGWFLALQERLANLPAAAQKHMERDARWEKALQQIARGYPSTIPDDKVSDFARAALEGGEG